jgi:ABC-type uncharacterized transport system substrate-binding protein
MDVSRSTQRQRAQYGFGAPRCLTILTALLALFLGSLGLSAAEPRPRRVLVLDQSETTSPFYYAIFTALRSTVTADSGEPVSVHLESLDLDPFNGPRYEAALMFHLGEKYRDRPPGVLVAVGATSLQLVLRLRAQLWPEVPVVFCMVDEATLARLSPAAHVTGNSLRLRLSDLMMVARSLVPNLKRVALVGDRWEGQTVFGHFKEEIPAGTAGVEVIDLIGLPLAEVRGRVASLPEATAILYTAMYSDGAGTTLLAREALSRFADVANAPIVGAAETFLGMGATGGVVMQPGVIGSSAGRLALRIINGEAASQIPFTMLDAMRPIFDWREMRRWRVSEASLPSGSEIRFREPGAWDRYRWEIVAIAAVMLVQAALNHRTATPTPATSGR